MASAERLCAETTNNRISEIPTNVMDNIFDRMSIRDAAKTSILSTKWRYIWASYPKLVFDENFFNEINTLKHKNFIQYEFPKAINKVLLVHGGPVLEFSLHIPNIPINDLSPEIDQWMLFLSRNGIKKLRLENSNSAAYILPSYIFSCSSLIELKVYNCILQPPSTFGGFHYLVKLYLEGVSFSTNMSAQQYNFPVLEWLTICYCTGIEQRNIRAPMLIYLSVTYLSVVDYGQVYWEWFKSHKQLTVVHIELPMEVKNVKQTVNMTKFLGDIPKVRTLWLNGFSLKYLATGNPHKVFEQQHRRLFNSLPLVASLKRIRLRYFGVDDHDQISSVLYLLKTCPNLMNLELDFAASSNNVTELVTEYLEPSNCIDVSLDMLQIVTIRHIRGFKAELLFIKLILARSTRLQRMVIEHSTAVGVSNGYTIARELLRFHRASSRAEIIFVDPVADK